MHALASQRDGSAAPYLAGAGDVVDAGAGAAGAVTLTGTDVLAAGFDASAP